MSIKKALKRRKQSERWGTALGQGGMAGGSGGMQECEGSSCAQGRRVVHVFS